MALGGLIFRRAQVPKIAGTGVILRAPQVRDFSSWRDLRDQSRAHLTKWEPDWSDDDASLVSFKHRVRLYNRAIRNGVASPFFAFRKADLALVGGVSLLNIVRGATQSAVLGYWTGEPHIRNGYAQEGVRLALDYAFNDLNLNRVEAACQPDNTASIGLLEKLSFQREGYAEDYLHINGQWRDHVILAMTARRWCR